MKSIVFFNNKSGVGKTTLVYHLSYMLAELGYKVLGVDLDPQMNLTSMFLPHRRIVEIFGEENRPTICNALMPVMKGVGNARPVHIEKISETLSLIVGDLELSAFEDKFSRAWNHSTEGDISSFREISSFYNIIQEAGASTGVDIVLLDLGPNLGAINRAAVIASDYLIIPVVADPFSLQGMKNLGRIVSLWKEEWNERRKIYAGNTQKPESEVVLPDGDAKPIGYIAIQQNAADGRFIRAYREWADRLPHAFRRYVLNEEINGSVSMDNDPYCLATLRYYHSLMPMAMEVQKPVFLLKPADGAIGAHYQAVQDIYRDFKRMAALVVSRIGLSAEHDYQ